MQGRCPTEHVPLCAPAGLPEGGRWVGQPGASLPIVNAGEDKIDPYLDAFQSLWAVPMCLWSEDLLWEGDLSYLPLPLAAVLRLLQALFLFPLMLLVTGNTSPQSTGRLIDCPRFMTTAEQGLEFASLSTTIAPPFLSR